MGNQTIEKTTANALRVADLAGIPHIRTKKQVTVLAITYIAAIVRGQGEPLFDNLATCAAIHGS